MVYSRFVTAIGMINLFPIPVLDGGHLLFLVEAFVLKTKSQIINFLIQFLLLIGLMLFLFNDFLCP